MNDELGRALDRELESIHKKLPLPAETWVSEAWLRGAVNAFLITESQANEIRRTAPRTGVFYAIGSAQWEELFDQVRGGMF